MLSYEPLWNTMKEKGVTTYTLRYKSHIGGGTLQRLKNNQTVSTNTVDILCKLMNCRVEDVMVFVDK